MPRLAQIMNYLIFIDESHFVSVDQWKQFGWYQKGCYPLCFRQNLWRKQSASLLLAIGYSGNAGYVIKPLLNSGGVNEVDFLDFILELHYNLDNRYIFVMDNAKIHKSNLMKGYIAAMYRDGRSILFQPKYSPELNPIEMVFGFLKRRLKNHDQVPRDLVQDIEMTLDTLTAEDCSNTIRHVFEYCRLDSQ